MRLKPHTLAVVILAAFVLFAVYCGIGAFVSEWRAAREHDARGLAGWAQEVSRFWSLTGRPPNDFLDMAPPRCAGPNCAIESEREARRLAERMFVMATDGGVRVCTKWSCVEVAPPPPKPL